MASTINEIVHANTINHKEDPTCFEAAKHGAAPTLLAFLHGNYTRILNQIR